MCGYHRCLDYLNSTPPRAEPQPLSKGQILDDVSHEVLACVATGR
jgi:hypothetical protein